MTYPGVDLFPSSTTFPASIAPPTPVVDAGAYVELNGMLLTGTDAFGVQWETFDPIDGWDGSVASSLQLTQKTRAPGAWAGPRYMTPRTIGPSGLFLAPDVDTAVAATDRLNAAATLEASVFTVQRGSVARSCIVYRQDVPQIQALTDVLFSWSLDLVAPDPRKFTAAASAATGLPSATGGFSFPLTVPFSIASTVVSGSAFVTNAGNAAAPVVVRFDGPLVGPQVTHVASGLQLVFATSLSLGAGQFLTVDMEQQIALANGQSSRNSYITSRGYFGASPGVNEFAFTATSGSGQMTVTVTPAWQ